eukprot:TRINITY_DN4135_c0_g2_i2.p3 TRINITY_DN4135_c0_g2~~TRINITY_DN4135_c0_g2_i2.p3  ORF type:complete len:212 (-),score=89.88 TRINITY_DN4135_c0_g2_i2:165-800(-)
MREKWEAQARDYVEVRSTLEAQLADKQRLDQLERTRRDELRKADEDKWAVMASVKSLERQLHNTQQLQQAVDDENQQLHQQIERLKQEARQAQQQLEQAEASRDELSRQQTTHEAERRLYDERLAGLSDQLQIRKQASSVLQDELTALQRQLDDCKVPPPPPPAAAVCLSAGLSVALTICLVSGLLCCVANLISLPCSLAVAVACKSSAGD